MHKVTTFLVLIFIASCGARPQDWLNNPVFQPGWNPVAAQPAAEEPLGGEPEYVPVIPEAPLEEVPAYPASSGGELIPEKGSSSAGSTNEAASGVRIVIINFPWFLLDY